MNPSRERTRTAKASARNHGVPGPGRPRDREADESILDATLELLAERGFDGLSMEAVAARGGVGKPTIYRRWDSKEELVRGAVDNMMASLPWASPPDLGDTREELVTALRNYVKLMSASPMRQVMPALVAEVARDPELGRRLRKDVVARRRSLLDVLERGTARGDLRPNIDRDLAIDSLLGAVQYRVLVTGAPLKRSLAEKCVEQLLDGLAR